LSRRDSTMVARHEVPLEFGHLERGTRGDFMPRRWREADLIKSALIATPKIRVRN
jgi:hypothetical protein